ncbi:hypothetical protein D3C76_516640 [compost metagenome]
MSANCSTVCSRDLAVMVALSCWSGAAGKPPIWPAEVCTFCSWIAALTSTGVSWKLFSRAGSSQMRMAYWAPNTWKSPTPEVREIGSWILATT